MKRFLGVVRILVFILLFCVVFTKTTDILIKKEHKNNTVADFYKEPKNSIDVVFLGTSHAYQSFSPMELWEKEGITSYNLATSSQPLPASYYLMKEAIRTQHPKAVVVELHGVKYEEDYYSKARLHVAIDGIPMNSTKIEMLKEYLSRTMDFKEQLEYIFPISLYHTRWEELQKRDFKPDEPYTKGFLLTNDRQELEEPELIQEHADWHEFNELILVYIDKMIELCKENQVELIFCQVPMGHDEEYESVQRKVNTVMDYAIAKGVKCINYQPMIAELGLDFTKDYVNEGHLNLFGADKIMAAFLPYLKENCELTSHQGERGFEKWDECLKKYQKRKGKLIKKAE